jgi:hypothetical protein
MDNLIKVLEKSVENHGSNHPLTLGHLLNILKMTQKMDEHEDDRFLRVLNAAAAEADKLYGGGD